MSEDMSGKGLVPSGKGGLVQRGSEGNKLIRRAASDALVPIQTMMNQMETLLHRVGSREFHEKDFRQLQVWASEMGVEGGISELVYLFDKLFEEINVENCYLPAVLMKDDVKEWCIEGHIKFFMEFPGAKLSSPRLPNLTHLCWMPMIHTQSIQSEKLDLSFSPSLTFLGCGRKQLTELDLTFVPALKVLWCYINQLTQNTPNQWHRDGAYGKAQAIGPKYSPKWEQIASVFSLTTQRARRFVGQHSNWVKDRGAHMKMFFLSQTELYTNPRRRE